MVFKKSKRLMLNLASKVWSVKNDRYRVFSVGFHGDEYLLSLANTLLERSDNFIETGANVGSTLAYVARNHPRMTCLSCEPDKHAFNSARNQTRAYPNVTIFNLASQQFMEQLVLKPPSFREQTALFWLDAHSHGYEWPLAQEVASVTSSFTRGYILIDDFKVPGREQFRFHQHNGQECSFAYVRPFLDEHRRYALYYPDYIERTSKHHPLTGWGLVAFGDVAAFDLAEMNDLKIVKAPFRSEGDQAWGS